DTGTPVPTLHLQRPDGTTLTANNTHIEKLTNVGFGTCLTLMITTNTQEP
ncbi:hypothetical protein SAMN04487819_1421, partial [Actinopolyspora alba]